MSRHDKIKSAYKALGREATFYDSMMTYSTLVGKVICRLVRGMDARENAAYIEKAQSGISEGFFTPPFETRRQVLSVCPVCMRRLM